MTDAVAAAPATITTPYGTEHIEKVFDVAVEAVNNYKALTPTDSLVKKIATFSPTFLKAISAIDEIAKAGPEFKDLDGTEVQALADKYLPQFGLGDGKTAVYVKEGLSILVSGFKIFKAK